MSEIPTVRFYIEDDVLFKNEPLMGHEHVIRKASIFPKDAFIACYKKWIKAESEEKMADQIFIRPNILLDTDKKEELHRDIIQQMETGVVVLPPYCEIVHPTADDVLDKIIAEIEQERKNCEEIHDQYAGRVLENVLSLISKYKGGSK